MSIENVLQKNQEKLMAIPGVVGVGVGDGGGAPVLLVMVKDLTPELRSRLPRQLEGFPVRVERTGEVTAF